ncbi:hypothetical protein FIBSPDRAFT_475849 [Athelia psychrophila]|uniref:Uncharacterized protein n=1 Tax=Athelia psychrophila TaxID=1759441 RepID=A0A166L779_9AGAM|nr:hypothetical protein FIBSPDRAFT_475849 [Fibularhizoctonia sp. CBS 109695]
MRCEESPVLFFFRTTRSVSSYTCSPALYRKSVFQILQSEFSNADIPDLYPRRDPGHSPKQVQTEIKSPPTFQHVRPLGPVAVVDVADLVSQRTRDDTTQLAPHIPPGAAPPHLAHSPRVYPSTRGYITSSPPSCACNAHPGSLVLPRPLSASSRHPRVPQIFSNACGSAVIIGTLLSLNTGRSQVLVRLRRCEGQVRGHDQRGYR